MSEEQRIFDGKLYCPADADLKAKKLKTHNLCTKYNSTLEDETELRERAAFFRGLYLFITAAIRG